MGREPERVAAREQDSRHRRNQRSHRRDGARAEGNQAPPAARSTGSWSPSQPHWTAGADGRHILVGPIYIEGAEAGDSIEVRILEVVPRIPYGTVGATPGRGALPDLVPRPWTKVIMLDLGRNAGIFNATTEVPLAPFNGKTTAFSFGFTASMRLM